MLKCNCGRPTERPYNFCEGCRKVLASNLLCIQCGDRESTMHNCCVECAGTLIDYFSRVLGKKLEKTLSSAELKLKVSLAILYSNHTPRMPQSVMGGFVITPIFEDEQRL